MIPDDSPFHSGERTAQERCGVRDRIEAMGRRMIRDSMSDEHRLFRFPGAERLLHLGVSEHVYLGGGLGDVWSAPQYAREFSGVR